MQVDRQTEWKTDIQTAKNTNLNESTAKMWYNQMNKIYTQLHMSAVLLTHNPLILRMRKTDQ